MPSSITSITAPDNDVAMLYNAVRNRLRSGDIDPFLAVGDECSVYSPDGLGVEIRVDSPCSRRARRAGTLLAYQFNHCYHDDPHFKAVFLDVTLPVTPAPKRSVTDQIIDELRLAEASMVVLAEKLKIDEATVRKWLGRLETAQVVERVGDPVSLANVYTLTGQQPNGEIRPTLGSVLKQLRRSDQTPDELSRTLGNDPAVIRRWLLELKKLGLVKRVERLDPGRQRFRLRSDVPPAASHQDGRAA